MLKAIIMIKLKVRMVLVIKYGKPQQINIFYVIYTEEQEYLLSKWSVKRLYHRAEIII